MGAKIIDSNTLEQLYSESIRYSRKITRIAEEIEVTVKKLSSRELLDGMRGGQGDEAIEAMKKVTSVALDTANRGRSLARFIDNKIGGAIKLKNTDVGAQDAKAAVNRAGADIKK